MLTALEAFRPAVSTVGAQVRAGGPLQYPTIASMYLEVVFAFGLGVLLAELDAAPAAPASPLLFVALALIAEAITLTFTRAGLITMATSLLLVGVDPPARSADVDAGARAARRPRGGRSRCCSPARDRRSRCGCG